MSSSSVFLKISELFCRFHCKKHRNIFTRSSLLDLLSCSLDFYLQTLHCASTLLAPFPFLWLSTAVECFLALLSSLNFFSQILLLP